MRIKTISISHYHQAIKKPGSELNIVGPTPETVIEAIEFKTDG
ncbi:hypothetical protein [Lentilactobacillus hilgardii]|uniref:Uncharacterized protein n=1 Tax=Lentilactobacillus hilgardii (strain ATCC 8290 / DSM 20176 / CCUG 30140 / JCM 1155 / KCTC 3500 / NBRC 15886 / NCIMB 8040 / NRRL B-1843 / 9) TaxID=1423757 RepID=C0XK56_LENH9|nr:hypothetical protein [Lentilactobacillus hilgardii]EEI20337.1 hypothetical protein HMPREF0497_0827 [Lentilactobacillus buchneri ATCC 11577]EEI24240.1 hypothetical protein HMPREF0519_1617 [Lentilactobacillus hilgardii DSM 20176 = ATCC 8290]